jgi:hypothetical protein
MTTKVCWIALGLAALAIAPPASAGESSSTLEGYWLCQNIQASPTATLYVSELFEAKAAREEVYAAFKGMLATRYGVTSQVSCSMAYKGPGIQEKLKGDNQRWFQQIRAAGGTVVATGWTFGAATQAPAAAATAAAAPVASAAPMAATETTYQCWMNSFGNNYMTPSFASTRAYDALNADWRAYITQLHPPTGYAQVGCMATDPKQAANNLAQGGRTRVDWKE